MKTIDNIRKEFPVLLRKVHDKKLIYLDNAATSQKPKRVLNKLLSHYTKHNANIHRAAHTLGEESTLAYEDAHKIVADFINAKSWREIVFTKNATEAFNLLSYSLGNSLRSGDEIVISIMEHHSNFVPWQEIAKRKKCKLHVIGMKNNSVDIKELSKKINKNTKIVSVVHVSNVLGSVNDVKMISDIVHSRSSAKVIIDAAQSIQHIPIDVQHIGCDFLVFTGHKIYAPTGTGVLYGKKEFLESMPPFMTGGGMIEKVTVEKTTFGEIPYKFEAGTPPIAESIALGEAIKFVKELGLNEIHSHENKLIKYALDKLKKIKGITILGSENAEDHIGVISFNLKGIHSHDLATILDQEGIAIRSGHHCAEPLLNYLGLNDCARVSFAIYNTKEEVDQLIKSLEKAKKVFA